MAPWRDTLSPSLMMLLASLVTLAGAYLVGRLLKRIMLRRLTGLVRATQGDWDDVLVAELAPRLPRWSLLVAVYITAGFWPLSSNLRWVIEHGLFILAAASVTFFAAGVAMRLVASYGSTFQSTLPVTSLTQNLTWLLVMILGTLVALNGLGVSIAPMLTALGIGGLAVALALKDPLSNLFAGLVVTLERQLRVGDEVKLDNGLEGSVVDFSWRSTRLRTPTNSLVLVPNAKIAESIITNHDLPDRRVDVPVDLTVPYVADLGLLGARHDRRRPRGDEGSRGWLAELRAQPAISRRGGLRAAVHGDAERPRVPRPGAHPPRVPQTAARPLRRRRPAPDHRSVSGALLNRAPSHSARRLDPALVAVQRYPHVFRSHRRGPHPGSNRAGCVREPARRGKAIEPRGVLQHAGGVAGGVFHFEERQLHAARS